MEGINEGIYMLEFRLHSEGNNKKPLWGIAFRHRNDVTKAIDKNNKPSQIDIEFPDGKIYSFGFRSCFWNGCYEFVDAQVRGKVKPIKSLAIDTLGYNIKTKGKCIIQVQVVKHNQLLHIVTFE